MYSSMKKYRIAIEPSFKKGVFIPPPEAVQEQLCDGVPVEMVHTEQDA